MEIIPADDFSAALIKSYTFYLDKTGFHNNTWLFVLRPFFQQVLKCLYSIIVAFRCSNFRRTCFFFSVLTPFCTSCPEKTVMLILFRYSMILLTICVGTTHPPVILDSNPTCSYLYKQA